MALRPQLHDVLDRLCAAGADAGEVSIDAIGDALSSMSVSLDEIDALITALEAEGLRVVGPQGGSGETQLRRVIGAARALSEAGTRPTLAAIASHTGLSSDQVRHALALARVMQR
jgi:hypothetical protein